MTLSSYLTGDEWDACFFLLMQEKLETTEFDSLVHQTVDKLLKTGYVFSGLDEKGVEKEPVGEEINTEKLGYFEGGATLEDIKKILLNGRKFLKQYLPDSLKQTDEEFNKELAEEEEAMNNYNKEMGDLLSTLGI